MVAERAPLIQNVTEKADNKPFLRSLPSLESNPLEKPLAPLETMSPPPPPPEPAPWTTTAKEWRDWVAKRDAYANFNDANEKAIKYANENDLRGVPFS